MDSKFLKGSRFNPHSNDIFRMSAEDFETIDFQSEVFIKRLEHFINRHKKDQLPRLRELKRYYLSDNNINYRPSKTDEEAADNRISSDFARYITTFEQGYMLGKPIEYKNKNENVMMKIREFQQENNEAYHNNLIKTDLSIYGRAYELIYTDEENKAISVRLTKLDPEQTFIIYDDTIKNNSLMGVRYYDIPYEEHKVKRVYEVYTSDAIHRYSNDPNRPDLGVTYREDEQEENHLHGVQINEYANNEDRTGAYEAVLDSIDAYDLSQSELANFQQDTIDAMLVIKGNPFTGTDEETFDEDGNVNRNSRLGVVRAFKKARVMILDDNPNPEGSDPDAFYLKKEYDAEGAEEYKKRLVSDILRFTFTIDSNDDNFSGIQSGESMKYKLIASDNRRMIQERLFAKGLMRRLRLVVNLWKIKGNEAAGYDQINETNIIFMPNIPQNINELITNVKNVYGLISDETSLELLKQFTGVDVEDEKKRLESESDETTRNQLKRRSDVNGEE
ncbi:phage portal protein [Candidatus Enterococcus clewellii]|uniref:SPP1 family phage portal protein n=1 Tax=Candidatus Enterococcus clewellii TaxID=1834193 RepID=A0A242K3Q5_9ENTE|nr:phage portal protein [Enterococcus sp. 9E7_DIV0242]OTP13430.1 SPP1 family phage portal protein [Enterococcus sp. 9E7_DIV0242]